MVAADFSLRKRNFTQPKGCGYQKIKVKLKSKIPPQAGLDTPVCNSSNDS